ncbi:MAG: DUF5320 domain-containing protein [Candidatus Aenigmarchaeota archaeon]|nr:DUF5320 domain-containing protein [Candidatus Aenigmarchaeota archaeon]
MPNKDGTGPEGKGPKTGRQMGKCEGAEPVGRGLGRGMGRGFRRFFRRDQDQSSETKD